MLEIIGVGSLALAMNIFPTVLNDLNLQQPVKSGQVVEQKHQLNYEQDQKHLAKGKPHESKYRQEADRDSERHDNDRYDRSDYDNRYEEDTRIEDYQDYPRRTERDADHRRGEIEYSETSEHRDRDDYESNGRYDEGDRREAEYERERSRQERRESSKKTSIFDFLRTGKY